MKRTTTLLILAISLALTSLVLADPVSDYDLSWWTVDGGGRMDSAADGYALGGTIGQPDAGLLTGDNGYTLLGGFWNGDHGPVPLAQSVYLPLVLKAHAP